jgi:hypothetical protein
LVVSLREAGTLKGRREADFENGSTAGPFMAAKDNTWICVSGERWASIHGAVEATADAQAMVRHGVMDRGDGKNLQHKSRRCIPGRPRVFKLRPASFEEEPDSQPGQRASAKCCHMSGQRSNEPEPFARPGPTGPTRSDRHDISHLAPETLCNPMIGLDTRETATKALQFNGL